MDLLEVVEADWDNPLHRTSIVELIHAYALDPMAGGKGLSAEVKGRLAESLAAFPTAYAFIAFRSGKALGAAICFLGFSTFAARPLMNVHDMIVREGYRGQGIGKRLLEAVDIKANALACCKATLEVREDNSKAYQLYCRHGFRDMNFGGEESRVLFMEKPLGKSA